MIFKASRLSDGNKLFPIELELKETCLEIKTPGFLNSVEKNYDYQFIQNFTVNNPMVGFCSFSFDYNEEKIEAHGFKDDDMNEFEEHLDIKKKEYLSNRRTN